MPVASENKKEKKGIERKLENETNHARCGGVCQVAFFVFFSCPFWRRNLLTMTNKLVTAIVVAETLQG